MKRRYPATQTTLPQLIDERTALEKLQMTKAELALRVLSGSLTLITLPTFKRPALNRRYILADIEQYAATRAVLTAPSKGILYINEDGSSSYL